MNELNSKTEFPKNAYFLYDYPSGICNYDGEIHAYDQGGVKGSPAVSTSCDQNAL